MDDLKTVKLGIPTPIHDELRATVDSLENTIRHKEHHHDMTRRELDEARRLFMELYAENRTLKLRFQWLEDAATNAVNACEKHEAENMDALRDELGLEMRGD